MIDYLEKRPLLRFCLTVLALLPACFILWHLAAVHVAAPAVALTGPLLSTVYGSLVESVSMQGTDMLVMSRFGETGGAIVSAQEAGNQLAYPVNTRTLSYSIPFYAALHFATPQKESYSRFAWYLLLLWLLLALGLFSTALKDLMLGLGPIFLEHPKTPPADGVALAYQFSTLIVPPLMPVILWAYAAAGTPLLADLLPAKLRPAQESDDAN